MFEIIAFPPEFETHGVGQLRIFSRSPVRNLQASGGKGFSIILR